MKKVWLLICLFVSILMPQGCGTPASQVAETENSIIAVADQTENLPSKNETQTFSNRKADFKGVSFDYNPQIFGNVEAERTAENPLQGETDISNDNYPKHINFSMSSSSRKLAKSERNDAEIKIKAVPTEDFRRMFAISKDYTKPFDERLYYQTIGSLTSKQI